MDKKYLQGYEDLTEQEPKKIRRWYEKQPINVKDII